VGKQSLVRLAMSSLKGRKQTADHIAKRMAGRTLSDRDLILRNVSPEPTSGCWLWTGVVNGWRYGRLGANRRERQAHRLSFRAFVGDIPSGLNVLHRCDTPECVNPDHLFLGTLADNVRDCIAKGRHKAPSGEAQPNAKLTAAIVGELRRRSVGRGSVSAWAREFGVSRRAIRIALRGETWSA